MTYNILLIRAAVAVYLEGFLPDLRDLSHGHLRALGRELVDLSEIMPLDKTAGSFCIKNWGHAVLNGRECMALLVGVLWIGCKEDPKHRLVDAFPEILWAI